MNKKSSIYSVSLSLDLLVEGDERNRSIWYTVIWPGRVVVLSHSSLLTILKQV